MLKLVRLGCVVGLRWWSGSLLGDAALASLVGSLVADPSGKERAVCVD